ncbi:uroporphyrinogen-III synthase [Agriterribacter sp.]|uniref:uroporphyrinogen-III synthase n=1 Tax=Agriterribacter sp. TaxID=2821509 RepID=UPI002B84ED3D|nr:uroporphyrinogen-III synthase [Agriterribacter sp.]HRO44453.1 uroporphyrinogen-III synthase [Agriterribacter sp.]HRQ16520.1 uroporphyrinogen-III synthase [Agriterribacter sp.]
MAENKIEILSTRELNTALLQKAALQNINVEANAFIKIIPEVSQETRALIQSLAQQQLTVIFTSVNAVNVITTQLTVVPAWKIFCIGGATKNALLRFFNASSIIASAKNAILLSEKIMAYGNVKEVVFICGNSRMDHLPDRLGAAGIKVNELVVYQTVSTPIATVKDYGGILFFSPSAVHSFFSINTLPVHTVLFSIGESTTAAIAAYCSNKVVTSSWPAETDMLDMVTAYFK